MRRLIRRRPAVAARAVLGAALAALSLMAVACGSSSEERPGQGAESPNPAMAQPATPSAPASPDPAAGTSPDGDLSARTAAGEQTTRTRQPTDPASVTIPSIDADSRLVRLGLNEDRTMEVPDDFDLAGWYVHGPRPGEVGPAVIAGHVSSTAGPAVFYRLHELSPGDEVHVTRADGQRVTFEVDRVEQHPKSDFPTREVYGDTRQPTLRLITCGGEFDEQARSHRDNIIVFATRA